VDTKLFSGNDDIDLSGANVKIKNENAMGIVETIRYRD